MSDQWLNNKSKELFKILSQINDPEDMACFCRDLMTSTEIGSLSGRWQAAQLLSKGIPQREVSKRTGVSIATVTRVNKWLNNGMSGYKKAISLADTTSHTTAD